MELSDRDLLSRLQSRTGDEHAAIVDILLYLNEVERRRLPLTLGYATMFDFATRDLRYSSSSAGRRIQVARCIARHPELLEPLRTREVNLSTVALISGIVDDRNVQELIDAIREKSQREVEQIAAMYRPAVEVRDRVRPVRGSARIARPDTGGDATPLFADAAPSLCGVTNGRHAVHHIQSRVSHSRCGSGTETQTASAEEAEPEAARSQFKIQFAAGPEFVRKLEEARAILSSGSSKGVSLEQVLETALDAFLDRKSPFRRKARRDRSAARRKAAPTVAPRAIRRTIGGPVAGEVHRSGEARRSGEADRSRHIPAAVRESVFARDGGRCTYVGAHGVACESRHNLHVDHVEPFVRGGPPAAGNLRLLCAAHNQLEAERVYGSEWMRRFRREENDTS